MGSCQSTSAADGTTTTTKVASKHSANNNSNDTTVTAATNNGVEKPLDSSSKTAPKNTRVVNVSSNGGSAKTNGESSTPSTHNGGDDGSVHSTESAKTFGSTPETDRVDQNNGGSHISGTSNSGQDNISTGSMSRADSASVGSFSNNNEKKNPKSLAHVSSMIGLDSMIENRREEGGLTSNVVHMEVPFGKPIEEVYDGVHDGPVLGSGISGLVRLVEHKATKIKYAVKCLDLALVDTPETLQQLREEIYIMCQLDHPNIVRLEEVYESHSEIYLVQELCLGGELFDRLDEQPDYHYTEAECARLVKQMLSAVRYLHSKGIIHRDLKLENFLFSSTAQDSELKMIDFGLSKHFSYGEVQHEAVGTPYTVAPEVIKGSYDERCDIWAIGVITFLLLSGDSPFGGCGGPEPMLTVRSNILRGSFAFEPEDIWSLVSQKAKEFIHALLVTDPKQRPTAREAQTHAWLIDWATRTRTKDDNVLNPNVVKALVTFKEFSDMRKLLCEVLSFTLLPDQIKDLRKEFEKMDTDGSGEISLSALKQVLVTNAGAGSLGGLTEEEVEDIFNAMRVNKTETRIHWHEFIAAGLSQCQVDDRNLRLAFDRLDSGHKGYVTLDDILDLVGSDALHNEENMRKMWGDSVKAANCNHTRVTYADFLLLMKGQTREPTEGDCGLARISSAARLAAMNASQTLQVVLEDCPICPGATHQEEGHTDPNLNLKAPPMLTKDTEPGSFVRNSLSASHSQALVPDLDDDNDDYDNPLSMDDEDGLEPTASFIPTAQGQDHSSPVTFSPPVSPVRGARDFISPLSNRISVAFPLPEGLRLQLMDIEKPRKYVRKRSRSLGPGDSSGGGDNDAANDAALARQHDEDCCNALFVADSRRALLLPEHEHDKEFNVLVNDKNKTALQVNRQLYRAHRQMRLAVLEASKRFEEEQARHAKEQIMAQREHDANSDNKGAGLVMRRGHNKQVSSETINKILEEKKNEEQVLMEKANRRGGRGPRNRKKTISDMSGMIGSFSQDNLQATATAATATAVAPPPPMFSTKNEVISGSPTKRHSDTSTKISTTTLTDPTSEKAEPQIRSATVPGQFKDVKDPFSKQGKYGSIAI